MSELSLVAIGACIGIVLSMSLMELAPTYHSKAVAAVEECEKSLPRDQHCIITAVRATPEGER